MTRRHNSLTRRDWTFLVFATLAGLIMLAAFIAMNVAVARPLGGGGDFLLPWQAARTFLVDKGEPYGGGVAHAVQQMVYGRNARPGEKPYILDTPFPLLLFYFPFGVFKDPSLARGIHLFLLEVSLLGLILFSLRLTDWQPRRLFLVSFFILCTLGFYSIWALFQGSSAITLALIYAGILLCLRTDLDELTGALVALVFYRWEVGGLFLFLVFLRFSYLRRWRVLGGFFMAMFVLMVISFFVYPGWLEPYARANLANWHWHYGFTPGAIFARFWPDAGGRPGWILTGLLLIVLILEWGAARGAEFRRFYWAACLTLAITPLIGFQTEMQNLVVLIIPLAFVFAVARERWKVGYWLSGLLLLLVLLVPWALFLEAPLAPQLRDDLIFLFLPSFTVIGLYWIRWWAFRPARTWLERMTQPEYR